MSLHALAEPQLGIVTIEQLRDLGVSATVQRRLQRTGALVPVHRGVHRLPGYPVTHLQQAQAAICLVGPDGVVSHRSGAFLRGAPIEEPTSVEVIVPRGSNVRHAGIITHQPTNRLDLRPSRIGRVPVANPVRILLDLGASASPAEVAITLDHFLVAGSVTIASVMAARERHRRNGRRGLGALELVLHEQRFGTKPPDSVLELAFMRLIDRFGLPRPTFHRRLRLGGQLIEPDFTWPDLRLIVEVDGWAHHAGRKETEQDRQRDLMLVAAGWVVVRVTWLKVTRRPAWVAAHLQMALAHRSAG